MQEIFPDEMPYIDNLGYGTKSPIEVAWPQQRQRNRKNFEICIRLGLKINLKYVFRYGMLNQVIDCLGRKISNLWLLMIRLQKKLEIRNVQQRLKVYILNCSN